MRCRNVNATTWLNYASVTLISGLRHVHTTTRTLHSGLILTPDLTMCAGPMPCRWLCSTSRTGRRLRQRSATHRAPSCLSPAPVLALAPPVTCHYVPVTWQHVICLCIKACTTSSKLWKPVNPHETVRLSRRNELGLAVAADRGRYGESRQPALHALIVPLALTSPEPGR